MGELLVLYYYSSVYFIHASVRPGDGDAYLETHTHTHRGGQKRATLFISERGFMPAVFFIDGKRT